MDDVYYPLHLLPQEDWMLQIKTDDILRIFLIFPQVFSEHCIRLRISILSKRREVAITGPAGVWIFQYSLPIRIFIG